MPKLSICIQNRRVLLKHIYEFKLNNILYKKEDYKNSNYIEYYRIILHNSNNISYVYYKYDDNEKLKVYIKKLKLHNTESYAIEYQTNSVDYYINGNRLTYEEWRKHKLVRLSKIKKIYLNQI